jgi:DNA-directed RNA polymerase subunit delta
MEIDNELGLPQNITRPTDFQNLQNDEYGVNIDEYNDRCEGDADYEEHEDNGDYEEDGNYESDDEDYESDDDGDNDEYEENLYTTSPVSEHLDEDFEEIVDEDEKSFKGFRGEYGPYFQNFTSTMLFLWISKHMICKYAVWR